MTNVRRKLKIVEISLCREPANKAARVALFKMEDEKMGDENTVAFWKSGDLIGLGRSGIWERISKTAQAASEAGVTEEQAVADWLATDAGMAAYGAYKTSEGPSIYLPEPVVKTAPTGALAKIETAAEKVRKTDPSLTREQAFSKAMEASPELYREYKSERAAVNG